jgi:hypothetical protein
VQLPHEVCNLSICIHNFTISFDDFLIAGDAPGHTVIDNKLNVSGPTVWLRIVRVVLRPVAVLRPAAIKASSLSARGSLI